MSAESTRTVALPTRLAERLALMEETLRAWRMSVEQLGRDASQLQHRWGRTDRATRACAALVAAGPAVAEAEIKIAEARRAVDALLEELSR